MVTQYGIICLVTLVQSYTIQFKHPLTSTPPLLTHYCAQDKHQPASVVEAVPHQPWASTLLPSNLDALAPLVETGVGTMRGKGSIEVNIITFIYSAGCKHTPITTRAWLWL